MDGSAVLDTSVIIKWYRQEEILANEALALRSAYLDGEVTILVPSLLIYELANVLRYKRDLTTEQVQQAVQSLLDVGLEFVPPLDAVMRRAVEIARTYDTTVYDVTFAALAESVSAVFITADEQLTRRLEALSFVHLLGKGM